MRHLIRFASLMIQVFQVIGFLLFKLFVEPAEQAAMKATDLNDRPLINLKPKPTSEETVTDTISETPSIEPDTVSKLSGTVSETGQEIVAEPVATLAVSTKSHAAVAVEEIKPQLELVKPQIHDLTPHLDIPKPAIHSAAIADIDRAAQVEETLERAWNEGITTYKELMEYVKETTGKGCSRRVISEWKKSRTVQGVAS